MNTSSPAIHFRMAGTAHISTMFFVPFVQGFQQIGQAEIVGLPVLFPTFGLIYNGHHFRVITAGFTNGLAKRHVIIVGYFDRFVFASVE